MAINSLGYREWNGKSASSALRFAVIARTGIRRAWQGPWLRRLLYVSWMPVMWFAIGFFTFEKSADYPELTSFMAEAFLEQSNNPQMRDVAVLIREGELATARHDVWAWLLQTLFRYPQLFIMALMVGIIAPPLVSQDIRSRAFLLYFSRPLERYDYVLGKLTTLWAYLAMISMLPALALYVLGVLLSPGIEVVYSTWDLPIRIVAATVVLSLPTASLALCLSSLTQESRNAAFAWFALLVLGWVTFGVLTAVDGISHGPHSSHTPFDEHSTWSLISLYHTLGRVQSWVFGFVRFGEVWDAALLLVVITAGSLALLMRRVLAPMRA